MLGILVSPLEDLSPQEIPQAIEKLNLKAKIQEQLSQYENLMYSNMVRGSKPQRAHHVTAEQDEHGNVATSSNGQRGQTSHSTSSKGTSAQNAAPVKKLPTVSKWHPVTGTIECSKPGPYDFTKEINPSDNIFSRLEPDGKLMRYTATSKACVKCEESYKNKTTDSHNPMCYSKQCVKCHLFGHTHRICLQA
jgi:hypothetical protein